MSEGYKTKYHYQKYHHYLSSMVKHCTGNQRKMFDSMRQQVVNYFCPDKSVEIVDSVLAQIKMKASSSVRSFAPQESGFKCKCGHTEGWEYPTHSTCKKCALVKDKIHQGKAYRDIKERADLNGVGKTHDPMMSHGYNVATVPMQNADPKKRIDNTAMKKMVRGNRVHMDTKDKHILSAKAEFEEISARLGFKSVRKGAIQLFGCYVNSVRKLDNKNVVMAACMFHTFKKPSGKVWTKKFSKGTYNTSKKKRLKMMTYK